ncbi:MAG: hydantoinase B/oxoprolinase family protein [Parvibaculum sp.]|nr:hydantoinase B/oxoprolinase family protein [Parvibaculum sp.]
MIEEEVPFIQIVSKKLMKDNQGFGKHRGGMGYQVVLAMRDSPAFGFMLTAMGAKFPCVPGLFGGYGCPTYPLSRIQNVDVWEILKTDPGSFRYSIEELMNEQPFKDGHYSTHPMFLGYTLAQRGELYMISQGAGGGFGDPLERDAEDVMRDMDENLISDDVAWRIYRVVYDKETLRVDADATAKARDAARKDRIAASKPFKAFMAGWVKDKPSGKVPYYGSWADPALVHAGTPDSVHPAGQVFPPIMMPNPLQVKVDKLQAELDALKNKG